MEFYQYHRFIKAIEHKAMHYPGMRIRSRLFLVARHLRQIYRTEEIISPAMVTQRLNNAQLAFVNMRGKCEDPAMRAWLDKMQANSIQLVQMIIYETQIEVQKLIEMPLKNMHHKMQSRCARHYKTRDH